MPDEFISGPDWECSSGPILTRQYHEDDLWPHGAGSEIGGGDKDVLADGLHPVLAIGAKANRPRNLTGVVVSYYGELVQVNLAEKVVVRAYVANVLTYSGGDPNTFAATFAIGDPVYLDDSDGLTSGVTLSRSPLNSAGSANPLAGYLHYHQDEYPDSVVGGPNTASGWPKTASDSELVETELCVMLVNDHGDTSNDVVL